MNQVLGNGNLTNILTAASAYRQSAVLCSAIELNVFSMLDMTGSTTLREFANYSGLTERSMEKLLGVLLGLQLVEKTSALYRNGEAASTWLVERSPLYIGDGLVFLHQLGLNTWSNLTETMVKGSPKARQRTDEPSAEFWGKLTKAIAPFSRPVAQSLCRILAATGEPLADILDIGGGSGVFSMTFLEQLRTAKATQIDWGHVKDVARGLASASTVSDRFSTVNGDITAVPWGESRYDLVIISHILHQEGVDKSVPLAQKAWTALRPGGRLIINEYNLNQERTAPFYSLVFALSMVLQNTDGDSLSLLEQRNVLETAGFNIEFIYSPQPPSTIMVAKKM